VIIALPITHQPTLIQQALKAGKHVLSEKPIAADLAEGKRLMEWYRHTLPGELELGKGMKPPLWGVAENYRFMDSLRWAAQRVGEIGGRLVAFRLVRYGFVGVGNKYFGTACKFGHKARCGTDGGDDETRLTDLMVPGRKTPQYQGGFLLDGGVHFVAALRMLLGAAGDELFKVAGFSSLLEERLLPVDTINAVALTRKGVAGTIAITFGTEFKSGTEVEVITTNGSVCWSPTKVNTQKRKDGGPEDEKEEVSKWFPHSTGVKEEVAAFARSMETGQLDELLSLEEALKDLEVVQGLLDSGAEGGKMVTLKQGP
jgi:predicted dehydrogenase